MNKSNNHKLILEIIRTDNGYYGVANEKLALIRGNLPYALLAFTFKWFFKIKI